MKILITSLLILTFLFSCSKEEIDDGLVVGEPNVNGCRFFMGDFKVSEASKQFLPYFDKTLVAFKDSTGVETIFSITRPIYSPPFSTRHNFGHPDGSAKRVFYSYTNDNYELDIVNTELSVKFNINLRPDLCGNPNLQITNKVKDHLVIAFSNSLDTNSPISYFNELMKIIIEEESLCLIGNPQGKFFPDITLLDKNFENVFSQNVDAGPLQIKIYYNSDQGIIAFEKDGYFGVVDRIE